MGVNEWVPVGEPVAVVDADNVTSLKEKIEEAKQPVSLSLMPGGKVERKRGPKWKEGENYKTGSEARKLGMEALIEWHVTPQSEREPRTKQELADALGVTPKTLRNWEKDSYVQRQIAAKIRTVAKVQKAADVIDALYTTATDVESSRQVAAAKVWLDWVDRSVDDMTAEDLAELTNEELATLMADLHDLVVDRD